MLADVPIHGQLRKLVFVTGKTGMYFILDRIDGSAPLGIDEVPVPTDPRQTAWPTQPFPRQGGWTEQLPGRPSRSAARCPATRTAPCPTTPPAASARRTGTARRC